VVAENSVVAVEAKVADLQAQINQL